MPRQPSVWKRKGRDDYYTTISGRQVNLGPDRAEALKRFHGLKASTRPIERSSATVRVLVDLFLDDIKASVRPTTWANYRWYLEQWISHSGSRTAATIRVLDLTSFLKSRHWNSSSRRCATKICRQWSRWCFRQGYLDVDSLSTAKLPASNPRSPATSLAIEQFLASIHCKCFRDVCVVLLDSGCRPGEIRSLSASQLDVPTSTANVVGKTGPRIISLTQRSVDILAVCAMRFPVGPLLRNCFGRPWTSSTLGQRFRWLSRKLGIHIIPYSFRHAFWSRAVKAGVDSVIIARQLGHRNIGMLLSTYAHVDTGQTKDAVEKASANNQ